MTTVDATAGESGRPAPQEAPAAPPWSASWLATRPSLAWAASSPVPWRSAWGWSAWCRPVCSAPRSPSSWPPRRWACSWPRSGAPRSARARWPPCSASSAPSGSATRSSCSAWTTTGSPSSATAAVATVRLFLLTWLIVIVMLTLSTLRLPSAFTAVFALVDLALLLLLLAFGRDVGRGRALVRPDQGRRLRGAGLRRGRRLPVLQRVRRGHRRQAPPARPPAALTPDRAPGEYPRPPGSRPSHRGTANRGTANGTERRPRW